MFLTDIIKKFGKMNKVSKEILSIRSTTFKITVYLTSLHF